MNINICQAIARQEGSLVNGSRPAINNNPGDLEYGPFAKSHGADRIEQTTGTRTPRFAHFPDLQTGYNAMKQLLLLHYKGMTIEQMVNKYAPPIENASNTYIRNVCSWTGLTPNTVIDNYLG